MANKSRDAGKERAWRKVLARFEKSGLTIRAFCRREKLSEPSFYAWRREIARRDREGKPARNSKSVKRRANARKKPRRTQPGSTNPSPAFIPVLLGEDARIESSDMVLELRDGRRLRLPELIEPTRLATLVHAIEAEPQA